MQTTLSIPSLKGRVSDAEWQTRVDLAACYRLVAAYGWDDLIFTHITAKIPDTDNHFLINPYGMMFEEITASSLVKIDLQGNKLDTENPFPINPAGFVIHSAIHEARHDAKCVLHTHTLNGVAVSAQKEGVLPISQQSIFVLAAMGKHGYEGVALNDDEKPRLVRDLGENTFFLLANHGLLTVGETIADAFLAMYVFESVCAIQVRAQAGGGELTRVPQAILDGARHQMKVVTKGMGGALAWPGLLRKLDRKDASFRT
jgi:ribulose-5-phosphate 4-epimerase/fuculose-1-phosphate aldolase